MKVAVVGATGLLGQHVVLELRRRGLAAIPSSRSLGLDLCDREAVREAFAAWQPDAVMNCACLGGSVHFVMGHAADVIDANTRLTLNIYDAAVRLKSRPLIVNPLANCSYSEAGDVQVEDQWLSGPVHESVTSFGNATRMKYFLAKCYAEQYKMRSINLLAGGLFGPLDHLEDHKLHAIDGLILRIVRAKLANEPSVKIWGTGKPVRECFFVKDFARLLVDVLATDLDLLYPVNVSQSFALPVNEIAQTAKRVVGYQGALEHDLSYKDGAAAKAVDNRRFRSLFPQFRFTEFEQAVRETAEYYLHAVTSRSAAPRVRVAVAS